MVATPTRGPVEPMAARFTQVAQRFPKQAELIEKLTLESEAFRSLCEDYTMVVQSLAQLRDRQLAANDEAAEDYSGYRLELELDIADALATWSGPGQPRRG
jgi:hypothetical protein